MLQELSKYSDKKIYLIAHKQNSSSRISLSFNIMTIRVFPLHKKKKMVWQKNTCFIFKPKLSENMTQFTYAMHVDRGNLITITQQININTC